jgi:hypothetical protein
MPRKRVCPEFAGRFGEYPKTLLEPIVRRPPVFGLLTSADEKKRRSDEEENRVRTAFVFKLRLLAKHFDINWDRPNMLGQLALKLAQAHVPGMQIVNAPKRRRGAPRKHSQIPFVSQVDAIAAKRNRGIGDAVRVWGRRNQSTDTEPILRSRYYRERRRDKELAAAVDEFMDRERSK